MNIISLNKNLNEVLVVSDRVLRNITALDQINLETILREVLMLKEKFWIFSNRIKIIGAALAIVFEIH
jgi:hypothetical protein